jgi:hypothetical protein
MRKILLVMRVVSVAVVLLAMSGVKVMAGTEDSC